MSTYRSRFSRRVSQDPSASQRALIQRMALSIAKLRGRAKHQRTLVLADLLEESGWKDSHVPTGRKGPVEEWNVYTLDVWGNRRDGYEINERWRAGTIRFPTREYLSNVIWYRDAFLKHRQGILGPPRNATVRADYEVLPQIRWRLFKKQFFQPFVKSSQIEFDNSTGDFIEVNLKKSGKPLFQLERQDS